MNASYNGSGTANDAHETRRAEEQGIGRNVKNVGSRLAVDAASAIAAGGLVAPTVTIIDK